MAESGSCMATLSPCQCVSEIKVATAGAGCCQVVSGHFPLDMCLPVTVLGKELAIQTLAAMALAVYTVIERRGKVCAMKLKSSRQSRHSVAMTSLLLLLLLQRRRRWSAAESAEGVRFAEGLAP